MLSYHYELPFNHFLRSNRLTSGWVISGITRLSTGLPISLSESDDNSLTGTSGTGPGGESIDTPNYTPGKLQISDARPGDPYFNTALFSPESVGQLGTANKRFFHGPGINNFDMALLKDTHIRESMILQFRLAFFNIFNHAQFNNPSGNINNTTFGYVISARDPRIGQLALKLRF